MKDFVKKYQNHKIFTNLNIIVISLILALWINFFLIDGTDIGKNLKASVLNTKTTENKSDLYIEKTDSDFFIVSNKNINQVANLSLSLAYNPDNISISNMNSSIWDITNLSNTPWMSLLLLTNENLIDIKKWDKLIKLNIEKKNVSAENINILNANFKDWTEQQFLLSTSWITF